MTTKYATPYSTGVAETCSVSASYMAKNAKTLKGLGQTEAQFKRGEIQGAWGVHRPLLDTYPDGKVLFRAVDNTSGNNLTVSVKRLPGNKNTLRLTGDAKPRNVTPEKFETMLEDEQLDWCIPGQAKPSVGTTSDSVGAMTDEDVAAMFVTAKDEIATVRGINIRGANSELDQEVFKRIGVKIGYTPEEVKAKVDAYRATGKKLSSLKKKVLKKEKLPDVSPGNAPAPGKIVPKVKAAPNGVPTVPVRSAVDSAVEDAKISKKISETPKTTKAKAKTEIDQASKVSYDPPGSPGVTLTAGEDTKAFKHLPYLDERTPGDMMYNMLNYSRSMFEEKYPNISVLDIARAFDRKTAKKAGVANEFKIEKKLADWASSSDGKAYIEAKIAKKKAEEEYLKSLPPLPADSRLYEIPTNEQMDAMHSEMLRAKPWTAAEEAALRDYSGAAYNEINHFLRGKSSSLSPKWKETTRIADEALRPAPSKFTTIRGTDFGQFGATSFEDIEKLTGTVLKDDGFISSSASRRVLFRGSVKIEIEVPEGTRGAFLHKLSKHPDENEFVMAPGTEFTVLRVWREGGQTVVRMRAKPFSGSRLRSLK